MELEWDSVDNWEYSGILICNVPNTYWLTKLCLLGKSHSGGIAFCPLASAAYTALADPSLKEEIEKLKWVPEDLGKARTLIETIARMEGYDDV